MRRNRILPVLGFVLLGLAPRAYAHVAVTITPKSATVGPGKTQTFAAMVTGTSNLGVTWTTPDSGSGSVNPVSGIFTFTAPLAAGTYRVVATSVARTSRSATATVTVPALTVTISPAAVSLLDNGATQLFTAAVSNASNDSVTWSVTPTGGGTITPQGPLTALYATPSTSGAYHVIATSVQDPSVSATATVTVPSVTVAISPTSASLNFGQRQQFTATVSNTKNLAVTWSVPQGTLDNPNNNPVTFTAPSTAGTFSLKVTTADGAKTATAAITVLASITVPTAPGAVTATAGVGTATLSWTAPTSNGGSPIEGYTVTVTPSAPLATATISGTTASVTGLANGATYTFTVAAFNAVGTGPASAASNAITTPTVPGAPTNVVGVAGDQTVSLTWTAPSSTGGSPITSYAIVISPPAPSAHIVTAGTSASVSSLTDGTPYTFTVAAVNAVGTGAASLPSAAVTPNPPNEPPSGLTYATNPAIYAVGAAIVPNPPSSGGGAVTSYSVLPPLPAGLALSTVTGVLSGTPTAAADSATYIVTATNSLGSTTVGLSITVNSALLPTLAQRRAFGALVQSRGLSSTNFTIRMQNPVGAGNCVVLIVDYSSGLTIKSITDNAANAWSTSPAVSANAGSGLNKTEAYVLENANAGARNFTITFSATESNAHFILLEYYNVATSGAVGVTTSSTTARAPTISTAAIAPAAGSLVLHYSMDNAGIIAGSGTVTVTSFTAGTGWTLEAADYASGNSGGPTDMSFFVLQTLIAPGGSITPIVTTTGKNTVNSIALELKASAAGTAPSAGIRVLRMQDYLNSNLNVSTWSEPFPSSGNLLAVFDSNGNVTHVISDSNSNAWKMPVTGVNSDVVSLNYAASANTSPTLVMHWPITGTGQNTTVTAYDITGADPVSPYVQAVTTGPSGINGPFTGQPIITPHRENGVVIVVCGDGIGPITALTQPAGAYYLSDNYPGETDQDTIDNADGYALYYYGTNLATQNYGWAIGTGGNSANATGAEFACPAP